MSNANIELRNCPIWGLWTKIDGKKVPISGRDWNGTMKLAKSNSRYDWVRFDVVYNIIQSNPNMGISVCLGPVGEDTCLCGIDLDNINGPYKPIFKQVLAAFKAEPGKIHVEKSPSGNGVKIYFLMNKADVDSLPMDQNFTAPVSLGHHTEITFHRGHRFFAVTDEHGLLKLNETISAGRVKWLLAYLQPAIKDMKERKYKMKDTAVVDRSSAVLPYISQMIDKGVQDMDKVYENILQLPEDGEDKHVIAQVKDWINEQLSNGSAGARQLQRAFEYVTHRGAKNIGDLALIKVKEELSRKYRIVYLNGDVKMMKLHGGAAYSIISRTSGLSMAYADVKHLLPKGHRNIETVWTLMDEDEDFRVYGFVFDPENAGELFVVPGDKLLCDPDLKNKKHVNTCKGKGVTPDMSATETDVKPFLDVLSSVTGGEYAAEEAEEWLLKYLAHIVQKPLERPSVHPVLLGPSGTGKDTLVRMMEKVLPKRAVHTVETVAGQYNRVLGESLLIHISETKGDRFRKEFSRMKALMTDKAVLINEKYVPAYEVGLLTRFLFSTNEFDSIPMEYYNNRRLVAIECSHEWSPISKDRTEKQRKEFWNDVNDWLQNENSGAKLLGYLLKVDISDFNPFSLPKFTSYLLSTNKTMGESNRDIYDLLYEEIVNGDLKNKVHEKKIKKSQAYAIETSVIYDYYLNHVRGIQAEEPKTIPRRALSIRMKRKFKEMHGSCDIMAVRVRDDFGENRIVKALTWPRA